MTNPNLSSGQVLPGFFGYVDYNSQGPGVGQNRRALLWGYVSSAAQRTPNQPFLPSSQQEADDGCGRGSDLANDYAAAVSQSESQGAEVWLMPIAAPSGGVAATYKLQVLVGTIAKAGSVQGWIGSRAVPAVGFGTADTATTLGDGLAAAILTMLDLPIVACTNASGVLTITYRHKGTTGEDFPMRWNVTPSGTNVYMSPGTVTFATVPGGSAGSVVTASGAVSVSTAIDPAVETTLALVAAKVISTLNGDSYPFAAKANADTAKVDLLYVNDKDLRRTSVDVLTFTGTTATISGGSATNGAGTSSPSYNGTQGTTAPSLSGAITNLAALDGFRSWSAPWLDAVTVGALATDLEAESDGSITGQKQQHLTLADYRAASVAGALPLATTPALTTSAPHYALLWEPDAPVPAREDAARVAAARAAIWLDTPNKNWNGFKLRGNDRAPHLLPPTKPSVTMQNSALRTYALAPVVKAASGVMEVVKGRTTSLATNRVLWAWSSEAQAAFHEVDLVARFKANFEGGSILRVSEPKTAGVFDKNSFVTVTQDAMRAWERAGHYDGADLLAPFVRATPNAVNVFRMDVDFPESPVLDLDQVVFAGHFTSPTP